MGVRKLDINDFLKKTQDKQVEEKRKVEQGIEKYTARLYELETEVNDETDRSRLIQIKRTLVYHIHHLQKQLSLEGYHYIYISSKTYNTFTGFLEWKKRECERIIAEYNTFLAVVNLHIEGLQVIGRESKKPPARVFANFTDKLQNGFTEENLNGLLIHVNFKNKAGETIRFTKYLMHQVIDTLVSAGYFDKGNTEHDQKAFSRYLGLPETRVSVEHGKPKKSVVKKVESYLSELKNQRKING